MVRNSKEIYFQDNEQKEKYERYAEELGFKSFSSFVRYCINFTVKNINMDKRFGELESKLDLVLDSLSRYTETQVEVIQKQESFISSIESISTELQNTHSGRDLHYLISTSLDILGESYPKWITFKELVEKLNIEDEPRLINLLRDIAMEPNKVFDNFVERRGDKFRAREIPKYEDLSVGMVEFEED